MPLIKFRNILSYLQKFLLFFTINVNEYEFLHVYVLYLKYFEISAHNLKKISNTSFQTKDIQNIKNLRYLKYQARIILSDELKKFQLSIH
ncbi:hypothetical protein BpHYR1_050978 [Brachionus plicatilis]|uniref:Uncharacterized protein n=1 Tax=Brachionus plicatilis TaxID=10195 RepID=A0A3M7QXC0_BRAPC|nr:hypothetical protein BpHYR1_050978 [Brachionus plicatilis]